MLSAFLLLARPELLFLADEALCTLRLSYLSSLSSHPLSPALSLLQPHGPAA